MGKHKRRLTSTRPMTANDFEHFVVGRTAAWGYWGDIDPRLVRLMTSIHGPPTQTSQKTDPKLPIKGA